MGKSINIRELFKDVNSIRIPNIQRDYAYGRSDSQTEEKRNEFLAKLKEFLVSSTPSCDKYYMDYVFGSVVEDKILILVDGQQRFTSLFLLYYYFSIFDKSGDNYRDFADTFSYKDQSRLLYETRDSSRDFCNAIVQLDNINNLKNTIKNNKTSDKAFSDYLIDQKWFFGHWKDDSTVKGMLVFLDAIHERFKGFDCSGIYIKLNDIQFETVDLNKTSDAGISPYSVEKACELYIKMNSRGKRLTRFENLKDILGDYYEKTDCSDEVMTLFDVKCTDALWNSYDKNRDWEIANDKTGYVDNGLLTLFNTLFIDEYALSVTNKEFSDRIKDWLFKDKGLRIPFTDYGDILNEYPSIAVNIYKGLNNLIKKDASNVYSFNFRLENLKNYPYYKDDEMLMVILRDANKKAIHIDRLKFFAYRQFLKEYSTSIDQTDFDKKLEDWMRLASNLILNSRETINTWQTYHTAINRLKEICKYTLNDCLVAMDNDSTGFRRNVFLEEKAKIELIINGRSNNVDWETAITDGEKDLFDYFSGQVRAPLLHCKDIKRFKEYIEVLKILFIGEKAELKQDETDGAFVRALLSEGDYCINPDGASGLYELYGYNGAFDENWSCYCRNADDNKIDIFSRVIDKIILERDSNPNKDIKTILENIIAINASIPKDSWKKAIIDSPCLFKKYTGDNICFFEDKRRVIIKKKDGIFTVASNKKQLNAMHKEYHSYKEYCRLMDNNEPDVSYTSANTIDGAYVRKGDKEYHGIEWDANDGDYRKIDTPW